MFIRVCILICVIYSCENLTEANQEDTQTHLEIFNEALTQYKKSSFDKSKDGFKQLIEDSNCPDSLKGLSYTGLGYSYLQKEDPDSALIILMKGLTEGFNQRLKDDMILCVAFIETWENKNYSMGLSWSSSVEERNPNYTLFLEKNINIDDVKLLVVQNYYFLNLYEECLKKVQSLGKLINTSVHDADLPELLLKTINELSETFRD